MENTGYITIQGWMVNELSLSGNELICYALIYGFSQDSESEFKGSHSYVAKSLGVTRENARRILKKLVDNGFIIKRDEDINGVKFCRYSSNMNKIPQMMQGASKQCRGCIKTEHNNIKDNIEKETISLNNKDIEKKYSENFSDEQSLQFAAESSPLKAEEQEKEKKNSAKRKESEAVEKTWRNDFDTYLAEVYNAMDELLKDNEYRALMTSYYPNIDYDKTIDKSVKCYWGTYFGWEQKKKNKRVKNIDMLSTLKKNFDKSKVYKPRSFGKQEQDNDKMYHSKKRDAGSVYHDYAGYGTERYRRFIKWLSDNATYIYEHYTYLITLNQFTEMVKVEGIAESMSEIILALAANPTEYVKYDNLYEYVKGRL